MSHPTLTVTIRRLGRDPEIFKDVKACTLDTVSGKIQVLPGHAPITTLMKQGKIKIELSNDATSQNTEQTRVVKFENIDALVKIEGREVEILEVF